jgi:hypothetical protein
MTTTILLINLGILAFVLRTGLGTRELNRRRFTLPVAIVAAVGWLYLRSIPSSTGDLELIAVLGSGGVLLGLLAGGLMRVRRSDDGSLVTVARGSYAAVWVAAIGGRLVFAYGANHWFAAPVAGFSRTFGIDSAGAWTSAFVIMALAMVLTRVAVTAVRGVRVAGGVPWDRAVSRVRPSHGHLHRHAY